VTACEKRSVDEVAVDVTAEVDRLLDERDWFTDILPAAQRSSHLADSDRSRTAASFSRDQTRKGHAGQHDSETSRETGGTSDCGWDLASSWGSTERRLVAGAAIVAELRSAIFTELGFSCSGGIAESKLLAKLGCGLHKPNQQTIVLPKAVSSLLCDLPLDRLPGLGGDLGAQVKEVLQVQTASELSRLPRQHVEAAFPRQASYLLELAEGRYFEPVQDRELCKSLSSAKTFFGSNCLRSSINCRRWLAELAGELHQRYTADMARHQRAPSRISVSVGSGNAMGQVPGNTTSASRQQPISLGSTGTVANISDAASACFQRWMASSGQVDGALSVTSLGLSLSGMQPVETKAAIKRFFRATTAATTETPTDTTNASPESFQAKGAITRFLRATNAGSPEHTEKSLGVGPKSDQADEITSGGKTEVCTIDTDSDQDINLCDEQTCESLHDKSRPTSGPSSLENSRREGIPGIDLAVLAELPPAIQAEVRAQFQQQQQRQQQGCSAVVHCVEQPSAKRPRTGGIASFFNSSAAGA